MEEQSKVELEAEAHRLVLPVPRRRVPWTAILGFVAGLVGVASLAASGWVYSQTQLDIVRLSTDIAQIRLSLELFGQQQRAAAETDQEDETLTDLSDRLAALEDNLREAPVAAADPVAPALPEIPAPVATGAAATAGGDCLPTGTRFLVSAGDRYPVCGSEGVVEIGSVDNGFMTLSNGTVIAAGGNIPLPNSACMIGVVSAGDGGMTGFAEIRVTC